MGALKQVDLVFEKGSHLFLQDIVLIGLLLHIFS